MIARVPAVAHRLVALALLLCAAASCGRQATPPAWRAAGYRGSNVLLVTIDTLRRDRLGAYGNPNHLTPVLDALAAEGVRYTQARAHVPMTLPSHTSILTGVLPPRHGVRNNVMFRLDAGVPTIATMMKAAGYRTGAFVGAFVLNARFGLNRGFDTYDDRVAADAQATSFNFARRRAEAVVTAAADWIAGATRQSPAPAQQSAINLKSAISNLQSRDRLPWFAWVHLFDPHAPYDAPVEFRAGRSPYDAGVAYTDAMLGRLFDRLKASGEFDHTIVIVTADHGESLGEHGETTHGLFAYDTTLAVPLIVRAPHGPTDVVDVPVGHVDLLPTVADLAGVTPPPRLDGRSLVREVPADRALYFEALDANLTRGWAPLTGVVASGWKYIDLPLPELYDLRADPREATNVAARDNARVSALAGALTRMETATQRALAPAIDADAANRLRALGYAGGAAPKRTTPYTAADDPKQLVSLNEAFDRGLEAFNDGRSGEALDRFVTILRQRPDFLTARTSAATVLLASARAADAVAILRAAPAEQATSPELLGKLGVALRDAGDLPAAAATLQQAQALGNSNPELLNELGVTYARLGRAVEARAMFSALGAADPGAAGTWYNLGLLELSAHRPAAAAGALRHAVAAQPGYGDAWQALGAALLDTDKAQAIDAWERAERLRPSDYDLLFNLGMVLAADRPRDAIPYLQRFVREAPRDRYAADLPRVEALLQRLTR